MTLRQRVITRIVRQFGRPSGIAGRVAGWVMTHRPSNRKRNAWVVSLLDVQPNDRVLEVGFGPGLAIAEIARRATRGYVYGVDYSELMLRQATHRNDAAIRAGRVELTRTSITDLPSFDGPLDAILAINSLGFWPDPLQRLNELRNLLRPGGRIAIATQPRCPGAPARPPHKPPRTPKICSTKPASPTPMSRPSTLTHQ